MAKHGNRMATDRIWLSVPIAEGVADPRVVSAIALAWLVRLRWLAVSGQTLTLIVSYYLLEIGEIPYFAFGGLVAATALSNVVLSVRRERFRSVSPSLLPAILIFDTLMLTGMLSMSGGLDNPLCLFYIVHAAMAAVALNWRWAVLMVGLSSFGLAALAHWHLPIDAGGREVFGVPIGTVGTWFAVTVVASVTAYFIEMVTLELRMRQQQLARVRSLAARNERLAALTTLAGGAAHELGTPLGTIALVAHELERSAEEVPEGEGMLEDIRLIRSQVDRCRTILDRMDIRIAEDGEPKPEDVTLDSFLLELREEVGKGGATVELHRPPEVPSVRVCRQDLLQVLGPLVKNALDASGGSGRVIVGVERKGATLRFAITDWGNGMTQEELQRVGEPFFTTKPPGKGMGLGLYLVRLLAERLGGRLELESEPGVGTTAILEIPEAMQQERA